MNFDSEDEDLLLSILILKRRILRKKKKKQSIWVKHIFREREQHGDYHILLQSMKLADGQNFFG